MNKVFEVKFAPWSKKYYFSGDEKVLEAGDYIIVKTELGTELGKIESVKDLKDIKFFQENINNKEDGENNEEVNGREIKPIIRKATANDLEKVRQSEQGKTETLAICSNLIKRHNLPMKLVDVHFSYDGGRITFAFIAEGRVDFRELVKDLTHKFQKSIRMHQIGVRDEAKINGDFGPCGRTLCCKTCLKDSYGGVTTEMAYTEQVAHRGLEKLAGVCGRLKCCLRYELPIYEELRDKLPPLESKVKTSRGEGKVVGWEILKQIVKVDLGEETIIEVPLSEIK